MRSGPSCIPQGNRIMAPTSGNGTRSGVRSLGCPHRPPPRTTRPVPMADDAPLPTLDTLRAEWRERLQAARDRAREQVESLGVADLRALRTTIREEMESVRERLPTPGPAAVQGPMTADEQAAHVRHALQYHALQVREQVVHHALRRRALGPAAIEEAIDVPPRTRELARRAWDVLGTDDATSPEALFRAVARRADDDLYVATVEKWLRDENPHHPDDAEAPWTTLRRAILLAAA